MKTCAVTAEQHGFLLVVQCIHLNLHQYAAGGVPKTLALLQHAPMSASGLARNLVVFNRKQCCNIAIMHISLMKCTFF